MALSKGEVKLLKVVHEGQAKENHRYVFGLINKGMVTLKFPYVSTDEGKKRLNNLN